MQSAALSVSSEPVTVPGTTSSSEPAVDTDPSADTEPAADTDPSLVTELAMDTESAEATASVADSENTSPESRFSRRKSVTAGSPLVSIPVLSKTNSVTSWISWIASPLRKRTPFSAPRPVPIISADGVAIPRAQGQAITSTASVAKKACVQRFIPGSTHGRNPSAHWTIGEKRSGKAAQTTNTTRARISTTGTNTAVTRSAYSWIGTRVH